LVEEIGFNPGLNDPRLMDGERRADEAEDCSMQTVGAATR